VRARVRGSTLDQLVSAIGPVPIARVATTIQQIQAALEWARSDGVVHRRITPQSLVFQQGNGRVFVSLELSPLTAGSMPDACDDAQTIANLTSEMLSGELPGLEPPALAAPVPPEVPEAVERAIEAMRRCDGSNATNATDDLLAALADAAGSTSTSLERASSTALEPVGDTTYVDPVQRAYEILTQPTTGAPGAAARVPRMPPTARVITRVPNRRSSAFPRNHDASVSNIGTGGPAFVEVKSGFGFNARLATTIVVVAIIAVAAPLMLRQHDNPDAVASINAKDTTRQSAGDIVPTPPASSNTTPGAKPRPDSAQAVAKRSLKSIPASGAPASKGQSETPSPTRIPRSETRAPTSKAQSETTMSAAETRPCASADPIDQQECLGGAILRNDRELNAAYSSLIIALRRQAKAGVGDPDPEKVDRLRDEQRNWENDRAAACRDVGRGPLYAKARSSCFAQFSENRTRALQRMLAAAR